MLYGNIRFNLHSQLSPGWRLPVPRAPPRGAGPVGARTREMCVYLSSDFVIVSLVTRHRNQPNLVLWCRIVYPVYVTVCSCRTIQHIATFETRNLRASRNPTTIRLTFEQNCELQPAKYSSQLVRECPLASSLACSAPGR